jgi:hypothetical protein
MYEIGNKKGHLKHVKSVGMYEIGVINGGEE